MKVEKLKLRNSKNILSNPKNMYMYTSSNNSNILCKVSRKLKNINFLSWAVEELVPI